jgi:fumarate reductase (CoM/CoB) subunit A
MIKEFDFDLVVIGAGGAGCTAAITAAREGKSIALLSKEALAIGNTRMSGGEIVSSGISPGDSPEILMEDMIRGGEYLNQPELVRLVSKGATSAIHFLESLGVFFRRDEEGRLSDKAANRLGGHRFHRSFSSPGSGMALGHALRNGVANEMSISVFEDTLALTLFREEDEIRGTLAMDLRTSKWLVLRSKATILATGGCGWIYFPQTTNNRSATGDGYAMAYQAGAHMVDMEMVQFFPFAMNHPACLAGNILDEPILAGPKGKLINGLGEVVADQDINLLTRAQVTALMAKEISAGRVTQWGGLKLDLSGNLDVPEMVKYKKLNEERKQFEKVRKGYGETAFQWKEPWDVSPSAHYMMGGVKIDSQGRSTLRNLYAVGEVAGGVMGANRLGATSLADIFVMGMQVGKEASRFSSESSIKGIKESLIHQEIKKVEQLFRKRGSKRPIQIERELQRFMREHVGIVRDEKRLTNALMEIDRLEEKLDRDVSISPIERYNTEILDAIELKNMLTCARMIATSARIRKESRGAHLRLDYPDKDDRDWLKNITLWKGKNSIETSVSNAMVPDIDGD